MCKEETVSYTVKSFSKAKKVKTEKPPLNSETWMTSGTLMRAVSVVWLGRKANWSDVRTGEQL